MELVKGQIVASKAGRDVARWYVVAGFEKDRVLLANGAKFTLAAPKPKNIRHISPTRTVLGSGDMQTDDQLKQALAAYEQSCGAPQQGG